MVIPIKSPFVFRSLLFLFTLTGTLGSVIGQNVWPGDVNNNGVVNGVDALYIGLAMGVTGANRDVEGNTWQGYAPPLEPWSQSFPNGLNYYFADINGDGEVKPEDVSEGPEDNYGETHNEATVSGDGFANAAPGDGPALTLVPSANTVGESTEVTFELFLGTEEQPITDFYGLSVQLSWNTTQGSTFDELNLIPEATPWIDPTGENHFSYFSADDGNGTADFTICRTNQEPFPGGSGRVAAFSIIMEDIVVGLEMDTFVIKVDSVLLINETVTAQAIVPDTAMVRMTDNVINTQTFERQSLQVSPNPADGVVLVESVYPVHSFVLYNAWGQQAPLQIQQLGEQRYQLQWSKMTPPGLYWLHARAGNEIWIEKVLILNSN